MPEFMRPVISYYGGKQRLANKIIPLLPQHTIYVEPFAGGAAVLFKKPFPKVNNNSFYREVINDHDELLINFYRMLQTRGEELVNRLGLTLYSEAEHKLSKQILKTYPDVDRMDAAWAYYVNARQSFSGILYAGWGRGMYGPNLAATWTKKVKELPEYLERISTIHICCDDALKIIKQWDSPQTLFYCDPPYPGTDQGSYSGYGVEDFQNLVNTLDNVQGSLLLSCYDVADVSVPSDWERFEFETYCSASRKGKVGGDKSRKATREELGDRARTEVVYRRFNTVRPREEIQTLYDSGAYDCFVVHPKFSNRKPVLF